MVLCSKCNTDVPSGKFCSECGALLGELVPAPTNDPEPAPIHHEPSPHPEDEGWLDRGLNAADEQTRREEARMAKLFGGPLSTAPAPVRCSYSPYNLIKAPTKTATKTATGGIRTAPSPIFSVEEVLNELNHLRASPAAFADRMSQTYRTFKGGQRLCQLYVFTFKANDN